MLYVSSAPLEKLQTYKRRMGWTFPWASSNGSDFSFDFGVSTPKEQVAKMLEAGAPPIVERLAAECGTDPAGYLTEQQALIAFAMEGGVPHETYSTFARGVEIVMGFYPLLDRAPWGATRAATPSSGSVAMTSTGTWSLGSPGPRDLNRSDQFA